MLGLTWPYRKVYTLDDMLRVMCHFNPNWHSGWLDERRKCRELQPQAYGVSDQWVRRRVPVAKFRSMWERYACDSEKMASYVERRRSGARPPPIVLLPSDARWRDGGPWRVADGNHRLRAAQCVGDKYIDAFIPVRKPPRRR